jgi:solute:Na+ symporter, SSS family
MPQKRVNSIRFCSLSWSDPEIENGGDARNFGGMGTYLVALLAYSAVMMVLGAVLSRRVRQASDFLVAGRKLGPGLIFSTLLAANIGAGSTVGAATLGYSLGFSAWWWVGSAGLGCLVLAFTVGPRIWTVAHERDLHTLGDFLERRYDRAVRGLTAVILWAGSLGLLADQLIALSILLNVVAGMPRWAGSILSGIVVLTYFVAGGLFSSAWINALQVVVLLTGFALSLWSALALVGGAGAE